MAPASVAIVLVVAACSGNSTPEKSDATRVNVTLEEWSIVVDRHTAPAGPVEFTIVNSGPDHEHEFVILETDLAPADLPANADGTVNEDSPKLSPIDQVEHIAPGDSESLTVDLEPGTYVLLCNLVNEGSGDLAGMAHYMLGMRTAFTVS